MNRLLLLSILLLSCEVHAPKTTMTNRIYFKICILNEKNEVLLVEHNNKWEPIGGWYSDTLNMEEYVKKLALTSNVKVNNIRLRGLFSVYFNQMKYPMVFHYYSVRYVSGKIKPPDDCTGVKWANLNEARRIMAYEEMLLIYEKILEDNHLWGGTYRITKDVEKGTRKFETIVKFFKLN